MCIKINVKKFLKRIFPYLYHKSKPEPQPEPTPPAVPEPIIEKPKPPWLGCSIYELVQRYKGEMIDFLRKLKKAGGNATEIFLIHSHNHNWFQPYQWDGVKFDLERWNEAFWNNFRYFIISCKDLGIVPFIRIHDQCSVKNPERAKFYCYLNNIQGFTNIYDEGLRPYYSKLNGRLIQELNIAGIETFFIVPMNEIDGSPQDVYDFHKWYVKDLAGK